MRCANQHSRLSMCRECSEEYVDLQTYQMELENSESNGTICKSYLAQTDKVGVFQATRSFGINLWDKASCDNCYISPLTHDNMLLTEVAKDFFSLANSLKGCIEIFPDVYPGDVPSTVCYYCQDRYLELNRFFRNKVITSFPYKDGICNDILDTMNMTQRQWGSTHFKCGKKGKKNYYLAMAALCVLLSPGLFYSVIRFSQKPTVERTILQEHIIRTVLLRANSEISLRERENQQQGSQSATELMEITMDKFRKSMEMRENQARSLSVSNDTGRHTRPTENSEHRFYC